METIKNPIYIDVLIPLMVIIFIIGVGVVLLYQHFQKNLFIHKLKQETLKANYHNDLLRSNIRAEEEERKRIAQDLHDEMGAVLSIMRMNLVLLEQQSRQTTVSLSPGIENVRKLTENAITSMRNISHRLMPPQLETFGLVKTLESVARQICETGKIAIQIHAPEQMPDLLWVIKLGLYRIVMELINNTIKHSGATQVTIDIHSSNEQVFCQYTDNGKGLNKADSGNGLGFKSIEGRINAMNGFFEIDTEQGHGFKANIRMPLVPLQNEGV